MDLLAELNRLRELDGKVPLKKWLGNEDQLKKAILDRRRLQSPQKTERELIAEYLKKGGNIKYAREASAGGVRRQGGNRKPKRTAIRHAKPKLNGVDHTPQRTAQTKIPKDCFTLVEMAKEMDQRAAAVRTLARKKPALADLNVKDLGRWVFRRSDWDRVKGVLWPNR